MSEVPNAATTPAIPPGTPYIVVQAPAQPEPKRGGAITKLLGGVFVSLFILSVLSNFYMAGIIGMLTGGSYESVYRKGDKAQRIVIVPIEGMITGSTETFAIDAFDALEADKENLPKAIILRVDSPGGYVGPSDRILHRVEQFKKDHPSIPVIGSFGSVAASGGYYVSAACDHIIAEPTCTTGSIGVIVMAMTYGKLMEKIGIDTRVLVADGSPKKDVANNPFRQLNEVDEAKIKQSLNNAHEQFVTVVARGRAALLKTEEVRALANGDTYTTKQAIANKLIDAEGYIDAAIAHATTAAKITGTPLVTRIDPPRGFGLPISLREDSPLPKSGEELRTWLRDAGMARLEYLWEPGR